MSEWPLHRIVSNRLKAIQLSSIVWLLKMKVGSFSTIPKRNDKANNGCLLVRPDRRRQKWANRRWKQLSLSSLTAKGSCTKSLYHLGRPSTNNFTWKYSTRYENELFASVQGFPKHGSFIMRTLHAIVPSVWCNFWALKNSSPSATPYLPDMLPCDFFKLFRVKQVVKGTHFESVTDIQNSLTKVLQEVPVEAFQKCYENWKKMLEPVCSCRRRVFWRGPYQCIIIFKYKYFLHSVSLLNYHTS